MMPFCRFFVAFLMLALTVMVAFVINPFYKSIVLIYVYYKII